MINEVYNYLIGLNTNYQVRPQTRYDMHKKSDLKNIYSKIKDSVIKSPLYLISPTESNRQFTLDIKDTSMALQGSISMLLDRESEDALMNRKKATVDNQNALNCQIIDEKNANLPEPFQMQIDHLATRQINTGRDCYVTGIGPSEGNYTFQIICEEETHEFSFKISENIRNNELFKKLSRLINKANLGLTATVEDGEKDNTIRLSIQSKDTGITSGSSRIFELKDIDFPAGSNGLIGHYGLNNMSTAPSNASFTINGEEKEALSNTFILNNSLHITLQNTAENGVQVNYAPDDTYIYDGIKQFASDYNNMIQAASEYPAGKGNKIIHDLRLIAYAYKNQLESYGINITSDHGKLELDESLVRQSIEEGDMNKLFSNKFGFISRVSQKINEIKINPLEYVDKKVVTYPNTLHYPYPNPYITSMYSGMFFNNYC